MHIAVCMNNIPVFVVPCKPSGTWVLTTKPTYYVAVYNKKAGTVVDAEFTSKIEQISFKESKVVKGVLNDDLTFTFNK